MAVELLSSDDRRGNFAALAPVDALLRADGRLWLEARRQYSDLVRAGVGLPCVWDKRSGQIDLVGKAFVQRMATLAEGKSESLEVPRAPSPASATAVAAGIHDRR